MEPRADRHEDLFDEEFPPSEGPFVRLHKLVKWLDLPLKTVHKMSHAGRFPRIWQSWRGCARVERRSARAWYLSCWVKTERDEKAERRAATARSFRQPPELRQARAGRRAAH